MSIFGAYLDWERQSNELIGADGFVSAYVEFDHGNLLAAIADILAASGDLRIDFHEVELLLTLRLATTDNVNGFIEIREDLVFDAANTSINDILPGNLQANVRVIYLGSRHNVPGPVPEVPPPPDHGGIQLRSGEPIFGIIDDGIGFLNSRFTCEQPVQDHEESAVLRSRFIACWLQGELNGTPPGIAVVSQGKVFTQSDMDDYLNRYGRNRSDADLYAEINDEIYASFTHRSVSLATSHATHLADIACGADCDDTSDPMQKVKLLGVQVPPQSIADTAGRRLEINILQGGSMDGATGVALLRHTSR